MLDYFIDNLYNKYNIIYMGTPDLHHEKTIMPNPDPKLRQWAAS